MQEARPGLKLKIKLGNKIVATRNLPTNVVPGPKAEQPQTSCRQTSETDNVRKRVRDEARRKRAELQGYVGPSSSPRSIVAALRSLEPFPESEVLPPWDDSLALPVISQPKAQKALPQQQEDARPSKRPRPEGLVLSKRTPVDSKASSLQQQQQQQDKVKVVQYDQEDGSASKGACRPAGCISTSQDGKQATVLQPGSSNSDNATTTHYQAPSPEHTLNNAYGRDDRAGPGPQSSHSAPAITGPSSLQQASQHSSGLSVSTQAGGPSFILPSAYLDCGAAQLSSLAQAFNTISPSDLLKPHSHRPELNEALVSRLIAEGQQSKREGDSMMQHARQWRVSSLGKYVEGALKFLQACEYMMQLDKQMCASRAPGLYAQTAILLQFVVKSLEAAKGTDLAKEGLRILCERLVAVCCMRQAVQTRARHHDLTKQLNVLIARHQQPGHGAGQPSRLGPDAKPAAQSPDDSTTSSQDAVGAHSAAGRSHPSNLLSGDNTFVQLQTRLLDTVQQVSKFAECLRRSTNSFQVFIERQDVRDNQQAKLASMHIAVVCMDVGMIDSFEMISHARQALECVQKL